MATTNQSLTGFSYAQAAKGRATATTTQLPSKTTPRSEITPTSSTFSELGPNANWADDAETTSGDVQDVKDSMEAQSKHAQSKDNIVERAKIEGKSDHSSSSISSPDLGASTATDDASSAHNGPASDSTWETKSQASEPAWLADRKERQGNEQTAKDAQNSSEESAASGNSEKTVVLQDARPPAVNPWAKRAEDAKAKSIVAAQNHFSLQPVPAPASDPKSEQRKKFDATTAASRDATSPTAGFDVKKSNNFTGSRANDNRGNKHGFRSLSDDARGGHEITASTKSISRDLRSNVPPPPTTDESSWPTPEIAQEKERKESLAEKEGDNHDADTPQAVKPSKKTSWKHLAVTPSVVWETPEMNRPRGSAGEKGGRSGGAARGRGGFRGSANGPKGGDRANAKATAEAESTSRGRQAAADKDAMPPPPKPVRPASGGQSRDRNVTKSLTPSTSTGPASNVAGQTASSNQNVKQVNHTMGQEAAKSSTFVPRNNPTSYNNKEVIDNVTREAMSAKNVPTEGKRESRAFDGYGKEWSGPPRGGKRGGRGRGGSREYANTHQSYPGYHNNYQEFNSSNAYGVSPSPSGFQAPRGNHQFGNQQQQGRGGWSRGGQRAQSIPEGVYAAQAPPFAPMQPIAPFIPSGYDQIGYPMPAMTMPQLVDPSYLAGLCIQLEYYFSVENLNHDMFLRKNMDGQGFVSLEVVAAFNRIRSQNLDKSIIVTACLQSETIEVGIDNNGREFLRRREDWGPWVLPIEERYERAQNDGPQQWFRPVLTPSMNYNMMGYRSPGGASPLPRQSYDSSFAAPNNNFQSQFSPFTPMLESPHGYGPNGGEEIRGRFQKSPIRDVSVSSANATINSTIRSVSEKDAEVDIFPDSQVNTLTVIVKPPQSRVPNSNTSSRTFSNGSIDIRSISAVDGDKSGEAPSRSALNGGSSTNGDGAKQTPSRMTSPAGNESYDIFWSKEKDAPTNTVADGTSSEPYIQLHQKALNQRGHAATGACPHDLQVLYSFWSRFLIRNFNSQMYHEFKHLAVEDAKQRHSTDGMQQLIVFYEKALSSASLIRDCVVKDYVELVNNEPANTDSQAFKHLRLAWRNGALNLKNRKRLNDVVGDELRGRLES